MGILIGMQNGIVAANGLLTMCSTFGFILSFVVTMNGMSIKLQKRSNDIVYAYSEIDNVIDQLKAIRGVAL